MKITYSNPLFSLAGAALLVCAVLPARADYSSTVLSQGPVGYWRLNETTPTQPTPPANNLGTLGDPGDGGYNGAPTTGLPGPFAGSQAVGLDGGATSVTNAWTVGRDTQTFSLELWANPSQVPKFAYVASSAVLPTPRSGWYLAQDDGSTFGAGSAFVVRFFNQNGTTPTTQLAAPVTGQPGTWYHIVLTYDGTVATLYINGAAVTNTTAAYVPNVSAPFSVGCRSDNAFFWPGQAAEVAMYGTALSASRVSAHYTTAMTTPAGYQAAVIADSPKIYYRFGEAVAPVAANISTRGAAANGAYIYNAVPGVAGPIPPALPGFEAANKAVSLSSSGSGLVRIPALNLNTNTVTICGWVKASGPQANAAAIVRCKTANTDAGLTIDQYYGNLGIGYIWAGNNYGWSPAQDSGFPTLPDSAWAFVAVAIRPTSAILYLCDQNNYANWASVETPADFNVNHPAQAFEGSTMLGAEAGNTARTFNGAIDEVTIFNRALTSGELYSQYAAAVGGVPAKMFGDLQGPAEAIAAGDPLVLTIDVGGTPALTYVWRKNGTPFLTNNVGSMTIGTTTLLDSGDYDVTVSNAFGSPIPSQTVSVTVISPSQPVITETQGFVNRTLYPKGSLRLAVVATGGGLKYQWYKNQQQIASATSSAFTIASVTNVDAGSYSVSVTNVVGRATNGPVSIAVSSVAPGSYEAAMVTANPVSWWRLDETPGSTYLFDAMGRHDGYYTNLNSTVPPVTLGVAGALNTNANTAASFNGTSPGIGLIPYSAELSGSSLLTIEGWVKTTALTSIVPFSQADSVGGMYAAAVDGWWLGNGSWGNSDRVNTNAQIAPGEWAHIALIFDRAQIAGNGNYYPYVLYVNGQTDGFIWGGSSTPYSPNASAPFIIGARNASAIADLFFNGQVDEVAVYTRKLSSTEIQNHFSYRLAILVPPTFNPAFIPQTVTTGKSVTFSTAVLGSQPISLQWYKGTTLIPGATSGSYNIPSTTLADSGTYTLWATNPAAVVSQSVNLTVISPVGYANVTNDLVLHLRFDGNVNDSSGRGNNGTAVGGPTYVPGIIGSQALQYGTTVVTNNNTNLLATSASYVNLGLPTDLRFGSASSFSIGLWVKLPVGFGGGDLPFIGSATNSMNNPGWALGPTYGGGGWQFCLNDGVINSGNNLDVNGADGSINNGAWHHFLLTVDRTAALANAYVDGVCLASRSIEGVGSFDNNNFWPIAIGQDPTGTYPVITNASATDFSVWGTNQTATLDDIGVWRRALTGLDVAQIASAGSTAGRSFDTVGPATVTIGVSRSGSSVTFTWTSGTLLQADTPDAAPAGWTPVPGASAPSYTFTPATTGNKFYKVLVQ